MEKIKNIILFILCLTSFTCIAKTDGIFFKIKKISGKVFISQNAETRELKSKETVIGGAYISLEEKAQITLVDHLDRIFNLKNQASIQLYNGVSGDDEVTLESGDLWMQVEKNKSAFKIKTANAQVTMEEGEAIVTYDGLKMKSQLLVLAGTQTIEALLKEGELFRVSENYFSFVDPMYEEGHPRPPTPVGQETLQLLVKSFEGIHSLVAVSNSSPHHQHHDEVAALPEKKVEEVHSRSLASLSPPVAIHKIKAKEKAKAKAISKKVVHEEVAVFPSVTVEEALLLIQNKKNRQISSSSETVVKIENVKPVIESKEVEDELVKKINELKE